MRVAVSGILLVVSLFPGQVARAEDNPRGVSLKLSDLLASKAVAKRIEGFAESRAYRMVENARITIGDTGFKTATSWIPFPLCASAGPISDASSTSGDFWEQYAAYQRRDTRKVGGKEKVVYLFLYVLTHSWGGEEASLVVPFWCDIDRRGEEPPRLLGFGADADRVFWLCHKRAPQPTDALPNRAP